MALVATVGDDAANSFVTVAESNAYFGSHWSQVKIDLWAELATKQKERLLQTATSILETLRCLDSELGVSSLPLALLTDDYTTTPTIRRQLSGQRLQFPRNIDVDSAGAPYIPQEVKDAQCEQAVYLVTFDEAVLAAQYQGVIEESVVAGSVRSYTNYGRIGTALAPMAAELMRPFLRPTSKLRRS